MKDKILKYLRESGGYVSGQELCEKLGVSRTAVWKHIKSLEGEGYQIDGVKNRGYCLLETPDTVSAREIHSCLGTKWLGRTLHMQDTVDSTNNWVKRLAEEGAPHGTVTVADEQTAGKGRRGRIWVTPKGAAAAFSLLLRPDIPPERASMLTLVKGLSVAQVISSIYNLDARIKWPNDVVVSNKKICGILTEMSAQIDYVNYVVIGCGINTNLKTFPEEIRDKATSLLIETGNKVMRAELIGAVLKNFEKNYEIFSQTWDLSRLMDSYNNVMINMDTEVKVMEPRNDYTGIARGINELGELLVEREDGQITRVYAGEVSVRGLYGYV